MKKNKQIIIIAAVFIIFLAVLILCIFVIDKKQFTDEKNNMIYLTTSLQDDNIKINNVSSDEFCDYGHQKYSKGSLGCEVSITFSTNTPNSYELIKQKIEFLGWRYGGDNTKSTNEYSKMEYIKHEVYLHKKLDCIMSYRMESEKSVYELSCYGSAKAEWFPVRDL